MEYLKRLLAYVIMLLGKNDESAHKWHAKSPEGRNFGAFAVVELHGFLVSLAYWHYSICRSGNQYTTVIIVWVVLSGSRRFFIICHKIVIKS